MNQQNCNCTPPMQPMSYTPHMLNSDIFQCDAPLAMAYVPWQTWNKTYDLDKALQIGTIFPCLDKPFMGRCVCK